ncbi:MAG: hypothetical protein HY268_31940 [Deltaproteobacteria bacterium]|nr:hypothetical protein [Deltaproteobacteria bacterium]
MILIDARYDWAQQVGYDLGAVGTIANMGNLSNFNLSSGLIGGGEAMPGGVLVKITGEIQCRDCTLEALGLEETPGDLYQFSYDTTHMVIKVTHAEPDVVWEMVERQELFLQPGEDPAQFQRLLNESKAGKRIEVTGRVAPDAGAFIPLTVKVK